MKTVVQNSYLQIFIAERRFSCIIQAFFTKMRMINEHLKSLAPRSSVYCMSMFLYWEVWWHGPASEQRSVYKSSHLIGWKRSRDMKIKDGRPTKCMLKQAMGIQCGVCQTMKFRSVPLIAEGRWIVKQMSTFKNHNVFSIATLKCNYRCWAWK